jgi:hypothetical protein
MVNIAGFDPPILCASSNTGADRDVTKHSAVSQLPLINVIFRRHKPPENHPHPSYSRLSRYDCTGLCWLLRGCEVVALTESTAAIRHPSGSITTYRRFNKPALGPVGKARLKRLMGRRGDLSSLPGKSIKATMDRAEEAIDDLPEDEDGGAYK